MANEIAVIAKITIVKDNIRWQNGLQQFNVTMSGSKGPTPDFLVIPTTGKDIYFDQLTEPGFCLLTNLDTANFVEYGLFDTLTNRFHPLGEIPPGTSWPIYLSRNLKEQYTNSGTGTTAPESYLRLKANGAACNVRVEAFER